MIEHSRQTIQLTVGFIVSPALELDEHRLAAFRARLEEEGIRFDHAEQGDAGLILVREKPSVLQVQVATGQVAGGAEPVAVSQLVVATALAPEVPAASASDFANAAHEVTDVARDVWPEMENVLGWNTGIRVLFASSTEHSFQYLWERRLGQSTDDLSVFGRPILGGGMRLVFPPGQTPGEQFQAEVRVESFLEDVRRLYVELNLGSGNPEPISAMNPTSLVQVTEEFLQDRLVPFLRAGGGESDAGLA
ncbi:MAG TPA: hypothetical protein VGR37_19505 [Longimicrobiaceae bacterium]|nr:hypothetical protein [Longimicrobiaceae bacterium]